MAFVFVPMLRKDSSILKSEGHFITSIFMVSFYSFIHIFEVHKWQHTLKFHRIIG